METMRKHKAALRSLTRLLGVPRGERAVLAPGLAVMGVVVGVLVATTWWAVHTSREHAEGVRRTQVDVASRLMAQSAESMLTGTELTALRRMVAEAAAEYDLRRCRIVLGDGTILADAEPGRIAPVIPEQWPAPGAPEIVEPVPGRVDRVIPLMVRGRGQALLEVSADVTYPAWTAWEAQAAVGVGGFAGVLLTYRTMRRRWRGLGAIADALRWEATGQSAPGSLEVSERFGPEAGAWNAIVRERDALRAKAAMQSDTRVSEVRPGGMTDLGAAMDALWHGVLVVDADGVVRAANGAAGVLLGSTREALIGAGAAEVLVEPEFAGVLHEVLDDGTRARASAECARSSSSGERTVLRVTVRRLRREDGAAAAVVIEDVTQQRVADESRNAFVAQATHELRTPLTNIRLYAETLVEEGDADAKVRSKCLNVITAEARRLERIVGDMLRVSEMEAGALTLHLDDVRLDALFEELEADFRAQAEDKEIVLSFELPPKLPVIHGDRDKIVLALHNLVGNALKYTPAGGTVLVRVEAEPDLRVHVIDNGIGIKPEEQDMVFERFYRAKDKRIAGIAGSGLGLALARQVARMHGGDITVESGVGKGSTFTLTVPLAQAVRRAA